MVRASRGRVDWPVSMREVAAGPEWVVEVVGSEVVVVMMVVVVVATGACCGGGDAMGVVLRRADGVFGRWVVDR